jgi:hypothetical protein
MKNFRKILFLLLIIPIAAIMGYYALIFLLSGPALDHFFELKNHDVGTHDVSVEKSWILIINLYSGNHTNMADY